MTELSLPKTLVCVVVYNRYHHLRHWIQCWHKCEQRGAQLVVIHNTDDPDPIYEEVCKEPGITYIQRANVGYDIGAFQDVCRNRLKGLPVWDRILWMTDDTFPMTPDFTLPFHQALDNPEVGVACMELSPYVTMHVRTTGFMIERKVAELLTFPVERILTKQHCYLFEHRGQKKILYSQVKAMGLDCVMVETRETSPMWDIGYHRRLDRLEEHVRLFGPIDLNDRILIICPVYKNYPQIASSMLMQTHTNWKLMLVHDGPDEANVRSLVPNDPRIEWKETGKRGGCWGHYIRSIGIDIYGEHHGFDYIVVTNPDNYHAPVYLEYLLRGFYERPNSVAVYHSQMVHSYKAWKVIDCRLEQGFIDCAGVMVRAWAAKSAGWNDISSHSADWTYFYDLMQKFGTHRFHKVEGCLLTHN